MFSANSLNSKLTTVHQKLNKENKIKIIFSSIKMVESYHKHLTKNIICLN